MTSAIHNRFLQASFFGIALLFFSSCCKDKDPSPPTNFNRCDTLRPVVFVHGFLASGDTWATQVMRFTSNGYCNEKLFAFDWNTLGGGDNTTLLNAFIDSVLAKTGATKIDLVGHSAGGGLGYGYCEDSTRAKKIAHYVHVASSSQTSPAGSSDEVPTLNISSADDAVTGNTTITGATNVSLTGTDHYQVGTCSETFVELYKFFNGGLAPTTSSITPETEITVSGKAVTLGENAAINGGTINIYEVNPDNGSRKNSSPDYTLTTNAKGEWGPQSIKVNTRYEFEISSNISGERKIHYYREEFTRTNPLVYLRTVPPPSTLAGTLLASLPDDDNQTVIAEFTSNQAVVSGRDSLIVDNTVLSTSAITPASATVIAMFLYDDNNNQTTDLTKPFVFSFLTQFLTARDMYFQTSTPYAIPIRFNGRTLYVPNLKSHTDGVIVAVFD